jgi:hypothetical protein
LSCKEHHYFRNYSSANVKIVLEDASRTTFHKKRRDPKQRIDEVVALCALLRAKNTFYMVSMTVLESTVDKKLSLKVIQKPITYV